LTPDEVFDALRLKGIEITRKQVAQFFKTADANSDKMVDMNEFKVLVHNMAAVDRSMYGLLIE
jgi:hypothetical protein